jgi:predicted transcriptional regulator
LSINENHSLKNRELHVHYTDPVKTANDPVNDPVKVNILQQLRQKQNANYTELAEKTGYSTATIKRHIQELKKLGLIERIGSDKIGYWKITE